MRTTLTLDDDVARELQQRAHGKNASFKQIVNETLRRGLAVGSDPAGAKIPFEVQAKPCGFLPGIDHLKLNQLVDEEEAASFIEQHRKQRPSR